MKRSGPPKRKTPLRRVNPERRKRLHERNFGDYADLIRAMPCVGCGWRPPSEAANSVGRKTGGCGGDKSTLVPFCGTKPWLGRDGCHRLYDEDIEAFTARTRLTRDDVRAIASELWKQNRTPE